MAYEKQIWEDYPSTNTPITSDRLNHIEQGIYDNSTDIVSTATQLRNEMKTNIITNQEVATNEYIDGQQIYAKKVEFTIPTTVNAWVTLIQLDNTVDDLIDKKLRYVSNGQNYDIPYNFENEEITVYFDQNNNTLNIKTNFAYPGGKSGWGILKYTKQESST